MDWSSFHPLFYGPCEYGEGVYSFTFSGDPVTADVVIYCDGMKTTVTGAVVEFYEPEGDEPDLLIIEGDASTTITYEDESGSWEGDPLSIYNEFAVDLTTKVMQEYSYYEYWVPVEFANTMSNGDYITSCQFDFNTQKFFKEKLSISSAADSDPKVSATINFSRSTFHDPECDSFDSVDFQVKGVDAEFKYDSSMDGVLMTLTGTHTEMVGDRA